MRRIEMELHKLCDAFDDVPYQRGKSDIHTQHKHENTTHAQILSAALQIAQIGTLHTYIETPSQCPDENKYYSKKNAALIANYTKMITQSHRS